MLSMIERVGVCEVEQDWEKGGEYVERRRGGGREENEVGCKRGAERGRLRQG